MTTGPVAGRVAHRGATRLRADLECRLARALDLGVVIVESFGRTGFTDDVVPDLSFGPDKVIAESTMLAYAASGASDNPDVERRAARLAEAVAPLCRSQTAAAAIALHPEKAFKYAVPHVLLTRLGQRDEAFDDFVRQRCAAAVDLAADLPASALAERRWILSIWDREGVVGAARRTVPDWTDLKGTAVDRPLDVLAAPREEVYALTHLLFYVSDFARAVPPELLREREAILADVRAALLRHLEAEDYDLSGELLMAWPQLGAPWDAVADFAFEVLATVEDAVGVLPCGNADRARFIALDPAAGERYARATSYHTAYVMGLLCAAALRRGALGVDRLGPRQDSAWAWPELLALVDRSRGHWQAVFDSLPEHEKPAFTPMLADLVLVQALDRKDYRAAHVVLGLAANAGHWGPLQARATEQLMALREAMDLGRDLAHS